VRKKAKTKDWNLSRLYYPVREEHGNIYYALIRVPGHGRPLLPMSPSRRRLVKFLGTQTIRWTSVSRVASGARFWVNLQPDIDLALDPRVRKGGTINYHITSRANDGT